jgi:uncharacterized protein with von Willebrand factor type A (vWA) domain
MQDQDEIVEIIHFYGHHYEADAFLFVIDRSGSMSTGGKWGTLLEEMVTAIQSLSSNAELGIVAFSTPIVPWNDQMVDSGPSARALAITFLSELQPMGATCISLGVNAGLQILRTSSKEIDSRRLILIGDGGQFCSGNNDAEMVVAEIVTGNWDMHRIDTIFLGNYTAGIDLFSAIAQENGGQMRIVQ